MQRGVLIFGASGYTGLELLRLLARHPHVTVDGASASTWAGEAVASKVPEWGDALAFEGHDVVLARAAKGHVALLATPAKTSAELAPTLLERGVSVIDLSGAFRLEDPALFTEWYGFTHPRPDLFARAEYGLPELFRARFAPRTEPHLVANPGCYATAAILAAAPLVRAGLVADGAPIVVDGKSGATGAGKALEEKLLFSEVAESMRPYRVGKHQHTPEIERALGMVAGREVRVSFTAHLVPMRRGLIASVYVPASASATAEGVQRAFESAYGDEPMIRVLRDRPPETGLLTGTGLTEVFAALDPRTRVITAFAAIDNLGKGAAGQAIQNLNALIGCDLTAGLRGTTRGAR